MSFAVFPPSINIEEESGIGGNLSDVALHLNRNIVFHPHQYGLFLLSNMFNNATRK